ncbi:bifunctional adenosylcobinamide kinase/adenosylcobinamide-phosphate guanylyltransferase [Candidatus Binatia bacterium]|nr:bifunctional adenosylcobinamide kinase/adenosylcobinamide-phosphate guanylyltransferase [Candidatus Binatia bacterium]
MNGAQIVLIGGGARSGKSRFALERARVLGARRVFVATGQAFDEEMDARIARHRAERGADFTTVEEPLALTRVLREEGRAEVVLVDCLTLWLSNLLLRGDDETAIAATVDDLIQALGERRRHVVLVTNEVGLGIVPDNALARTFRDVAGRAHQQLAAIADEVHVAILGTVLRLRPGPLEVVAP